MATRQEIIDAWATGTPVTNAKVTTLANSVYMPGDEIAEGDLPALDSSNISDFAEAVRDTIGTALTAGSNIDVTVDDAGNTITIAVEALTSADISDLAEFIRDTIATALTAGSNVTITPNDGSDIITIAASGGGLDAETVRDTIGTALTAGNNIDITVDDGAETITIAVESLTSADLTDFNSASDARADLRIANALAGATELTEGEGIDITGGAISFDYPLPVDTEGLTTLLGWTADPALASGSTTHIVGSLFMVRFRQRQAASFTSIQIGVTNAVTHNLTMARLGIYSISGTTATLLAAMANDVSTIWNSSALKTFTLTGGPHSIAAGYYYAAYILAGGATAPTFGKTGVVGTQICAGTSAAAGTLRCGALASQTDLPASVDLTTLTASSNHAVITFI